MEGITRSKLVFAAGHEGPEAVPIKDLKRVREPVSRSKSGVQGKVADVLHGRSRHAESQNEIKAFRILAATARADAWQEQPFLLEYHVEGKRHRYTPDVLVVWGSHQEVIEIKEDLEAELSENRARFDVVGDILAGYGYRFRLWKRSEICAEPRLTNASLVLRYRRVEVVPVERERIRRAFSSSYDLPLRVFQEAPQIAAVQSVLRLVLDGTLYIDWWQPLAPDSRVSIVPIGSQVWPCPPPCEGTSNAPCQCTD
jgi:TnsA endonuclease-like protein